MAYQNSIEVYVHISPAIVIAFNDAENAGSGSAALAALERKDQIDAIGQMEGESGAKRVVIPYESVSMAVVTVTRKTVDDPVDANCSE